MDNPEIAIYFSTFHSPCCPHCSDFQCSEAQSAFQAPAALPIDKLKKLKNI